ncbi:hypothetical protein DFH06DRAFT_1144650 [Mycena polygramma]|nr:hypothetical protein DFH06DRAFT_1144650 [Mycena polygramma]
MRWATSLNQEHLEAGEIHGEGPLRYRSDTGRAELFRPTEMSGDLRALYDFSDLGVECICFVVAGGDPAHGRSFEFAAAKPSNGLGKSQIPSLNSPSLRPDTTPRRAPVRFSARNMLPTGLQGICGAFRRGFVRVPRRSADSNPGKKPPAGTSSLRAHCDVFCTLEGCGGAASRRRVSITRCIDLPRAAQNLWQTLLSTAKSRLPCSCTSCIPRTRRFGSLPLSSLRGAGNSDTMYRPPKFCCRQANAAYKFIGTYLALWRVPSAAEEPPVASTQAIVFPRAGVNPCSPFSQGLAAGRQMLSTNAMRRMYSPEPPATAEPPRSSETTYRVPASGSKSQNQANHGIARARAIIAIPTSAFFTRPSLVSMGLSNHFEVFSASRERHSTFKFNDISGIPGKLQFNDFHSTSFDLWLPSNSRQLSTSLSVKSRLPSPFHLSDIARDPGDRCPRLARSRSGVLANLPPSHFLAFGRG